MVRLFSASHDFATPPSHSPVSMLDQRHTRRLRKRDKLLIGQGEEPNQITMRKPDTLYIIQYSLIYSMSNLLFCLPNAYKKDSTDKRPSTVLCRESKLKQNSQ